MNYLCLYKERILMKLYDFELSGNAYKVRLLLSFLKLEYERIPVSLKNAEQKSPAFMALNPLGQIPVLVDGDVCVRDSQAILVYLARRYGGELWLPTEAVAMGQVMQWLFTAGHEIQVGPSAARIFHLFGRPLDINHANQRSHNVLTLLNQRLEQREWLESDRHTIADVACFPYIALTKDAKISLDPYSNVQGWIERFKKIPGYIGMPGL
jgi:glutathione S-transferase